MSANSSTSRLNLVPNRIYLLGFMGSGKSTLGKKLANKLGWRFYDLDQLIEDAAGQSISTIFETQGEAHFRKLEAAVLRESNPQEQAVIALGGGTPVENMEWILKNGTSVYLKLSPKMLFSRLQNAKAKRPLIKGKTDEELLEFIAMKLTEREAYYTKAKIHFNPIKEELSILIEQLQQGS